MNLRKRPKTAVNGATNPTDNLICGVLLFVCILVFCSGCDEGYVIKNDGVYYKDWNEARGNAEWRIETADPKSFEILEDKYYGKDKYNVYYMSQIVKEADASTFHLISEEFAVDAFQAFYYGKKINGSSSSGFRRINDYYSRSDKDVYYDTFSLHVCSVPNFKVLDGYDWKEHWSTDGCYYYYMSSRIPSDDYNNVEILRDGRGFAKDKQWIYFHDHKLNYDQDGVKIMDTIDAATFKVTNGLDCSDKFGCINPYHGREQCK